MMPHIALVTGAAQGIGRAISLRLADDGFDVVISDLEAQSSKLEILASEIRAKGRTSLVLFADVSSEEDVEKMVEKTVSELGGLDVMVANAGIAVVTPLLKSTAPIFYDIIHTHIIVATVEDWNRVFLINVKGTLLCYKAAAKAMIKQKRGGKIIGASSIAGKKGEALYGIYSASKFSVRALTQVAAREWGRHGITVNSYAPGFIDTPLLRTMEKRINVVKNAEIPSYVDKVMKASALGRLGNPEDVARLVSFLASKDSDFMTGQTVTVDGGIWFD
ncbi:NAD-binding protein [Collybia nuda]|uniref:NAD-binding protein n=1 Tax=Collybia nuda TaxID=64659 RepID=A0A9P5YD54_9AGAR|nr:NAD-binding protein [Collybia nuda]